MRKEMILVAVCLVWGMGLCLSAQKRPYDQIMKDIDTTFAGLKKNLDAGLAPESIRDAERLQSLLKETEDFWVPFKTKDALDAARGGHTTATAVANAAREASFTKAQAAYANIGKYCKACHDSHRELMPDRTYRIKP